MSVKQQINDYITYLVNIHRKIVYIKNDVEIAKSQLILTNMLTSLRHNMNEDEVNDILDNNKLLTEFIYNASNSFENRSILLWIASLKIHLRDTD